MSENQAVDFFSDIDISEDDGTSENSIEILEIVEEKPKKIVYFDLETQKSFDDVGGWSVESVKQMLMSVGVIYVEPEGIFKVYTEDKVQELIDELFSADVVIGFNIIGFDYVVLMYYTDRDFGQINTIDMLLDVKDKLGFRLKLDSIAKSSLDGVSKSADGLLALRWFKEGKIDQISEYCQQDVAVTRDVFKYGENNKQIKYDGKYGPRSTTIQWSERKDWDLSQIRG